MAKSKVRAKKAKGKAWRTGRAGSEYEENSVGDPPTEFDFSLMPEGLAEVLSNALEAELADDCYADEQLGRVLIRRGWEPLHVHVEDSSDSWSWPSSAPGGDAWVPTVVTVREEGYLVQYADFEAMMRDESTEYHSREELLDDLTAIEAYRHPADSRD